MRSHASLLCVSALPLLLANCQSVQGIDDGRDWGMAEHIGTSGESLRPDVAMDPSGNAVAVWDRSLPTFGALKDIWSNRYLAATKEWDAPERIESHDFGPATFARVAMGGDGNSIAVWHQPILTRLDIWSNRYTPSEGWGAAEPIENHHGGRGQEPEVAMDTNGNAVAIWSQRVGPNDEIWSNRLTWRDPE
jgi:hypothetical protein